MKVMRVMLLEMKWRGRAVQPRASSSASVVWRTTRCSHLVDLTSRRRRPPHRERSVEHMKRERQGSPVSMCRIKQPFTCRSPRSVFVRRICAQEWDSYSRVEQSTHRRQSDNSSPAVPVRKGVGWYLSMLQAMKRVDMMMRSRSSKMRKKRKSPRTERWARMLIAGSTTSVESSVCHMHRSAA